MRRASFANGSGPRDEVVYVTPDATATIVPSWRDWRVLSLLVISGVLNYVDRTNLSIGATDIQKQLHLSNYELGLLLSAFFWTYAASQLFYAAGWLADRLNVCWVLAVGFAIWTMATAVSGLVTGFTTFFVLRLLLGAGESIAYPSYSRILVTCYPEHRRGFANAAIDAGTKLGPAIGALIGGFLIARLGWRVFFVTLGVVSALWLIPWIAWMPRNKTLATVPKSQAHLRLRDLLREPAVWWTAIGLFCSNYFWYFLITWLPPYLEKERGFPKATMGVVSSISYLAIALSSVSAGWLSDFFIARGGTPTRVRKTFAGVGLVFSTILLPVVIVEDVRLAVALLIVACVSFGAYTANVYAITQTLAGPLAAGQWTSLQNGFANLAGVAAPWFTGWVVQWSGRFYLAFLAATVAVLISACAFVFGVGRIERVTFRNSPPV
jgi:MFS transporter, ACS family, D-galactonate transporter